jgi:hypothetical protein
MYESLQDLAAEITVLRASGLEPRAICPPARYLIDVA